MNEKNTKNYLGLYAMLCTLFGVILFGFIIAKVIGVTSMSWWFMLIPLFTPSIIVGLITLAIYISNKYRKKYIVRYIYND